MAAIELDGVTKQFGDVTALSGVDLTVEEGEIFGFLGPNGAGKSTTINVLLDFIRPTAGHARVLGYDAQAESVAVRERTGVLPEGYQVYDRLTGRQHVSFVVDSKETDDDPMDILDRVGLAGAADRKAGGYSKGMAQRLVLGMSLVGDPDLLILDEPTTGLDPNGAREMREIIRAERDRGATVFFSSHILAEVEAVCDRVGILQDGSLVAVDTVDALRDDAGSDSRLEVSVETVTDDALAATRSTDGVSSVTVDDGTVSVACRDDAKLPALNALDHNGARVLDFTTAESSLEDLFVAYTSDEQAPAGRRPDRRDSADPPAEDAGGDDA
jgi:ABC-2 type transport system ATP-binding protein